MKGEDALVAKTRILTLTQIKKNIKMLVPLRLVNQSDEDAHTLSQQQTGRSCYSGLSLMLCAPLTSKKGHSPYYSFLTLSPVEKDCWIKIYCSYLKTVSMNQSLIIFIFQIPLNHFHFSNSTKSFSLTILFDNVKNSASTRDQSISQFFLSVITIKKIMQITSGWFNSYTKRAKTNN